ncbi:MAG: type 2 lantipeptide synthetase LanM [Anaerolineae bacterium]|nr:type 2 lantipeptide synthetase LanM [Anaerolineae bacterium]
MNLQPISPRERVTATASRGDLLFGQVEAGLRAGTPFRSGLDAEFRARFVTEARKRLADRASDRLQLLTENALANLEGYLLHRLSGVARTATLAVSYDGHRTGDWLSRTLAEYPVLAHLLATATDFWVETNTQFLERLYADRKALAETFGPPHDFSRITAITAGLSEPHLGGQTVLQLTFADGATLFYKPRPLDLDMAWSDLLHCINQSDVELLFTCPRILGREAYGWMEHVATRPCQDREQVARYYQRAGMLVCLLHLFGGSDFQRENVIACADQPVLIDLETLMTPTVRGQAFRLKPQRISETVLRTHFLSYWARGADGRWQAFGGMEALCLPAEMGPAWEVWAAAMQGGFRDMAHWLADHRAAFAAMFAPFEGLRLRVIFQDTRLYQRVLRRSLQPRFLQDGLDHRTELERLMALSCPPSEAERHVLRLRQEVAMLEQLDIPRFETRTDTADLPLVSGETRRDYFAEPVCRTLWRNLEQFNAPEQDRQLHLIQGVFDFKTARTGDAWAQTDWPVPPDQNTADVSLEQAAIELAEQVKRLAMPTASGAVTWMMPEDLDPVHEPAYQFRQCDGFLYQGSAGIALFLAAMETVRPGAGYGELLHAALRPLAAWLDQPWLPRTIGIGAAHGLGSLVYALVKTGQWLAQPAFIEQAGQVAALMTPERIAADERLDVFDGAAGAILGLLALYEATHDEQVLRQAWCCGDHLLARRTPTSPRAWLTIRATPVSGLSHGLAGIAYALLRLFQVTGQEPLRQAALEGIAFERQLFSAAAGNWQAFDSTPASRQPVFWTNYCHGAPGIGLARLGGLARSADTPDIREEIAVAVQTTAAMSLDGLDFLCCGNFGRLELLLTAGPRLEQPELIALARRQAARLVARQARCGGFRLFEDLPPRVVNPGLFRGIAGIGYELLRLAAPERWPNLLLWE